ncbi:putative protein kinase-like domain protein [Phaeoacremonium minimum UCRPA7]|uniref:Protein kinase domain-containing protein n=1 Tax=Phaeoacremonium minimum (strain UCR-PA7) TaxID=1286976 RepID=R8BIZ9_PHAM7|nr:putative protein kinase-like domain protein [Phaeoacremonium minimum UCRPA7]EON99259.1 putative protein kinase-like domain protein [Phaeoacremonium minimum UCRPA7]
MDDKRERHRPRYELETYLFSIHDDNTRFSVRRNGKLFHIRVSPSDFINSPITTKKYMSYLELLRSGEEVIGDVYDTDVFEWVTQPFEPLFVELAPSPVLPDNHTNITVTLKEYLFPDLFILALDVVDERLYPRRIEAKKSPYSASHVWLDDDDLDDLETWTVLYDPAGIVLSFSNPEDALFKPPKKVLIDNKQRACFFKPCFSTIQTKNELQAYKKIALANLDPHLNLCRLYGVVIDDGGSILGLLLSYIDHDGHTLSTKVDPDYPSASTRKRWMDQIEATVAELHRAGIVWGDVKAENVLVDREDNVWVTDFGGGYTEGWVGQEIAGTVEGDLVGMAKLREFVFQDEAQERWWAR